MKHIILDFDGTIGDTQKIIITTLKQTLVAENLPARTDEECAATIGMRLEEAFELLGNLDAEGGRHAAATYRRLFDENKATIHVKPFPHVIDTIRQLYAQGHTLSIASSRNTASLQAYLEEMQIDGCMACIVAGNQVQNAKPAPDMVLKVLELTGGKAEDALVVGDTAYDINMGRAAHVRTCGVTYGNGKPEEFANADYVIDDFADLLEIASGGF